VSRYLVRDWIEQLSEREERQRRGAPELYRRVLDSTLRNLREMIEADVHVLVGSDVAVFNVFPGSVHDELAVFVESLGLAPVDALQRATARSAAFLGIGDSVGMIREGYVADLLLLDASPLADIRNSSRIAAVIRNGYVFDRDGLEEVLQDVRNAEDLRIDRWGR
jgi:imidazolonepropionase-like amidohydrolase